MQNTSVGPFRSGDAVCRVSAQGLARTLWLPTSHPVVAQCIRSYESFCFFNIFVGHKAPAIASNGRVRDSCPVSIESIARRVVCKG